MWLNALSVYQLSLAEPATWGEAFKTCPAEDPGVGMRSHVGFAYLEATESFIDGHGDYVAFQAMLSERVLPKESVDREVRRRMRPDDLADEGKVKTAWAEVEGELLPRSPVRERPIPAVYDRSTAFLYVFGTAKLADDVVLRAMRQVLGSVHAIPVLPRNEVGPQLTAWMKDGRAPTPFLLGRTAELIAKTDAKGKSVFRNRDLAIAEIRQHLKAGDEVGRLALLWDGKVELSLNSKGEIRAVGPPECKMKAHQAFDSWPDIMESLPSLFANLMTALGGAKDDADREKVVLKPARVAILASGEAGDHETLFKALDRFKEARSIGEVVVPAFAEPLMRRAYQWARDREIKATVITAESEALDDYVKGMMKTRPHGILVWGNCERVRALTAAAAAKQVPVVQLDRRR